MWWIFWPALIIAAVSSRGTSHEQVRTGCNGFTTGAAWPESCKTKVLPLETLRRLDQTQAKNTLNGAALEKLQWSEPAGVDHLFTVGIIEFDDQGNAWDPGQVQAVQDDLEATLRRSNAIVSVFVHGWKNDCKACNGDLTCFRESLALLAANEQALARQFSEAAKRTVPAREVFGVFVAWRGASSTMEPAKELSFFSRKAAADRIGSSRGGELTRFLGWLNAARAITPGAPSPLGNMISLLGHSFGADVLFGAVANALDASIGAAATQPGGLVAKPFGDVLVLVNPAFEASAYRRFDDYASHLWKPGEPPLMVTVQARNDWATHYAFPVGRSVGTLAQSSGTGEGYRSMLTALGHKRAFFTHHLAPPVNAAKSVDALRAITKTEPRAATAPQQLEELVGIMGQATTADATAARGRAIRLSTRCGSRSSSRSRPRRRRASSRSAPRSPDSPRK